MRHIHKERYGRLFFVQINNILSFSCLNMKGRIHLVMKCLQGWVFNVVPWLLAIPTGFLAGWISDTMTAKG